MVVISKDYWLVVMLLVSVFLLCKCQIEENLDEYRVRNNKEQLHFDALNKAVEGKTVVSFEWVSSTDLELTFRDGTRLRIDARKYRPEIGFPEYHHTKKE